MSIDKGIFEQIQMGQTIVLHDGRRWEVVGVDKNESERSTPFTIEITVMTENDEASFQYDFIYGIVDEQDSVHPAMNHADTRVE